MTKEHIENRFENLNEIYTKLKNHPYRDLKKEKYRKNFYHLLMESLDVFYKQLDKEIRSVLYKLSFYHGWSCTFANAFHSTPLGEESLIHCEHYISTIHDYLKTQDMYKTKIAVPVWVGEFPDHQEKFIYHYQYNEVGWFELTDLDILMYGEGIIDRLRKKAIEHSEDDYNKRADNIERRLERCRK